MNLIELLVFLFALFISFLFGRFFFAYIGWWSVFPGLIFGFGTVGLLLVLLLKPFPPRREKLIVRRVGFCGSMPEQCETSRIRPGSS